MRVKDKFTVKAPYVRSLRPQPPAILTAILTLTAAAAGEGGELGTPLRVETERDVFDYLDMAYLEPEER